MKNTLLDVYYSRFMKFLIYHKTSCLRMFTEDPLNPVELSSEQAWKRNGLFLKREVQTMSVSNMTKV